MKPLFLFLSTLIMTAPIMIYDFNNENGLGDWRIEDDRVMGGISQGKVELTEDGHARFYGNVTVESNGGFSSVQNNSLDIKVTPDQIAKIKVKGDGNTYQFRIQHSNNARESYIKEFETTGEWQTIEIKLNEMKPTYRGRNLNMPNFNHDQIKHARFLIATKKVDQKFELLIDCIELIDA
ncbi:hypothetical protein AAU57_10935 [Nonlabens sp. YIK11]|uniref:CIA30 family protein n=1 Tax=Nonlabens sp. YIK11 TaxID=1453349 RepID=UPI000707F49E|nr:CIA30 family protein [Nonlabens sp. YIK11]KQC33787.1 hypothetical protein AAU57_10935 [Nonlabens sp. YIK11]